MSLFKLAYEKTLQHEGLYSNDKADRGGETFLGIARNMHPTWKGWEIIDLMRNKSQLTTNELRQNIELAILAEKFYLETFWNKLNLSKIYNQAVCDELFDTAVNQGTITAGKYIQESLNMLNNMERKYKDIAVDGVIGDATISAYYAFANDITGGRNTEQNNAILLKCLNGLQFKRYYDICMKDKTQEVFFYGWLKRV
jgi:lysozyme family protein